MNLSRIAALTMAVASTALPLASTARAQYYPQGRVPYVMTQPQPNTYQAQQPQYYGQPQPNTYQAQQPQYYGQPQPNTYQAQQPQYYGQPQPNTYQAQQPQYYTQPRPNTYQAQQPPYYTQPQPNTYQPQQPGYYPQQQPQQSGVGYSPQRGIYTYRSTDSYPGLEGQRRYTVEGTTPGGAPYRGLFNQPPR